MATDPLAGYRVLGFDLETTGFSPNKHRIVQYALVGCDADVTSMYTEELVNPQMKIPFETTRVHVISDGDDDDHDGKKVIMMTLDMARV